MNDWKTLVLAPNTPLDRAIAKIDSGRRQIALVADEHGRLLGTLADGDIRRAILSGIRLDVHCNKVMNSRPTTAPPNASKELLLTIMRRGGFHQVPLVDNEGILVGLITIDEIIRPLARDNWVVLMAGGVGSRLHPLTANCPKPLLKVGGSPILENILMAFIGQGFQKFFLSVNYRADMIIDHFGDGRKWGVGIHYLREIDRMGTAGALSLLPETPQKPLFVMNGDLLTNVDFLNILDFHEVNNAVATMAIREFDYQIPYGVVNVNDSFVTSIQEKPIRRFMVSSGIYVLSPEALQFIPKEVYYDMPNFFNSLIESNKKIAAYKFNDYWLDIGRVEEFERAQKEWVIGERDD